MILTPSLEEGEECPICINVLELNECSRSVLHRLHIPSIPVTQRISLSCQHIFCNSCLSKLGGGKDINCPQCRRPSDIEDLEQVEVTATQQWDQLLELAQQFAAMEGQLGPDTSEEEEEENLRENFIDDGDTEARFVVVARWPDTFNVLIAAICYSRTPQEHDTTSDVIREDVPDWDERDDAQPGHIPYSQSGVVEKRKRMKQLVAQRARKRFRA